MTSILCVPMALAISIVVGPTGETHQASDATSSVLGWLRAGARPLATAGDGRSADLQPVKTVLKEAQVVGLGEATHGTQEFFQLKRRLVQMLVTELGFSAIAIEAGSADIEPLNEYLVNGIGTLQATLTEQGYIAYDNKDFAALMEWLRAHNQRQPVARRVRIIGLDIMTNTRGRARVLEYVRAHAPGRLTETEALFRTLAEVQAKTPLSIDRERLNAALPQLQALHDFLVDQRARAARAEETRRLDPLIRDVTRMVQWSGGKPPGHPDRIGRSRAMGLNLLEIISQAPRTKVIAWAHNVHVALRGPDGSPTMASEIRDLLGAAAYYGIGFEFGQGSVLVRPPNAQGTNGPLQQITVPAASPSSLPWYLAQATPGDFFIDLRANRSDAVTSWLSQPIPAHYVAWNHKQTDPAVRPDTVGRYDGLVFVRVSSAPQPTPNAIAMAAKGRGI